MNEFPKHLLVSAKEVQSLIKAEWSVIRTGQHLVDDRWRALYKVKRFSDNCCGILFIGNYGFASNGHWVMKIRTDGPSVDPDVRYFFYDYATEEVIENYNPFKVPVDELLKVVQQWKYFNVKLRVDDIKDVIEGNIKNVRHRRDISFHAGYDSETHEMGIRLESKKGVTQLTRIPVYSDILPGGFPEFSVNLSYLHKILDIIAPWYNVLDFCFDGTGVREAIIIKAKNPYSLNKMDIRLALGQFTI